MGVDDILHTLHSKLRLVRILCLGQTVGVEENHRVGIERRLLFRELPFTHHADR